jgi:hypothetical protein
MTQKMQVGAKGLVLKVQIVDEAGEPVALDGTPVFHFEGPGNDDIEVNGVVDDADLGIAAYVLSDGDGVGETAGTWKYQVELDLDSGWAGRTTVAQFEAVVNLS